MATNLLMVRILGMTSFIFLMNNCKRNNERFSIYFLVCEMEETNQKWFQFFYCIVFCSKTEQPIHSAIIGTYR